MTALAPIRVRGLRKSYGDVDAVKGIDLEVEPGEVFALLGPTLEDVYLELTGGEEVV